MADVKNPDASKTVAGKRQDVTEKISGAAASAKQSVGAAAATAKEKASQATSGAKRKISEAGDSMKSAASGARQKYGQVKEKVTSADYKGMTSDLRGYIRRHPGKAIVIAASAGFLIGLLMRDSED